jgi:hypothetical protein
VHPALWQKRGVAGPPDRHTGQSDPGNCLSHQKGAHVFVLNTPVVEMPRSGRRAAMVTIVIGELYAATWMRLAHQSWIRYANTYDLDLIVIACPLDSSERAAARSPAWQKLLILDQPWAKQYERIIWLDSDIVISSHAQNIIEAAGPAEKISLTVSGGRSSDAERMLFIERLYDARFLPTAEHMVWSAEVEKNYIDHKVPPHDVMFNTGVMVVSPQHHNELFLHCYEHGEQVDRLYEQALLSHEIIERDLAYVINSRFNWGIQEALFFYLPEILTLKDRPKIFVEPVLKLARYLVRCELANSYFLHFYGTMNLMKRLSHEDIFGGTAVELFTNQGG